MRSISTSIAEMDFAGRSALPCIGAERADMVVAGCAILCSVMRFFQAPSLLASESDILDGLAASIA